MSNLSRTLHYREQIARLRASKAEQQLKALADATQAFLARVDSYSDGYPFCNEWPERPAIQRQLATARLMLASKQDADAERPNDAVARKALEVLDAQRAYFKTRHPDALTTSKRLERELHDLAQAALQTERTEELPLS